MRGVLLDRQQGHPGIALGLLGIVADETGRGDGDVVEDLGPLAPALPHPQRLLGMALGDARRPRLMLGEGAVDQPLHPVQIRLVEQLHPARRRPLVPVRDEQLLRLAQGAAHRLAVALGRLRPCLDGAEHGPGARQRGLARTGLGQRHQIQGVVRAAQVDHLPGGPGERLARPGAVAALAGRVGRDDEVLLGGGLQADVMGHPAGEHRQVGRHPPQSALQMLGVAVGEHAAHLVELADHGLALESAAAGRVPGAEDLDRGLQGVDLLGADRGGLIAVEAHGLDGQGIVGTGRVGGEGGVGEQKLAHGTGDGDLRRARRPHPPSRVG
ncbi:hypothetical protein SANTM175S_09092 [Streptomyces antimycoticus]